MSRQCGCLLALLLLWPQWSARGEESVQDVAAKPEQPVANFQLRDFQGKTFALGDFADRPLVVLAFLGVGCPLAKLYSSRLDQIATEYRPRGVEVLGINSNSQDSLLQLSAFARTHQIGFPLLKDPTGAVAEQMNARRTPEVFVLDRQRVVRYHGRIDDQYAANVKRPKPTRQDLRQALDELLAGKSVGEPHTEVAGCLIGRKRRPDETSAVTYANQIAPLLERRCAECHRPGQIAPFSLTGYDEVVGWAEMIGEVVAQGRMPPWHANPRIGRFIGDRHLSDEEKQLITTWVAAGAPRGRPMTASAQTRASSPGDTAATEPPRPLENKPVWALPRAPDVVVPMGRMPFKVPAQGLIKYKFFKVDPGFKKDQWISAAEILPGNRAVVHHAIVHAFNGDLNQALEDGTTDGFLAAYVPGMRPALYPPGMAKQIRAGAKLVFQIHYVANGSVELDCCQLGLILADSDAIDYEVLTSSVTARGLVIPPGAARHRVVAESIVSPRECQLLCMLPHMHLRGSAISYDLVLSNGQTETLLDVPHYDCNWQTAYRLVTPRPLPAGSRLRCVAYFDNSAGNLNNPDPSKEIRWGLQSKDEMMVGYFDIAVARDGGQLRRVQPTPYMNRKNQGRGR